jgi:hypothetical protein
MPRSYSAPELPRMITEVTLHSDHQAIEFEVESEQVSGTPPSKPARVGASDIVPERPPNDWTAIPLHQRNTSGNPRVVVGHGQAFQLLKEDSNVQRVSAPGGLKC